MKQPHLKLLMASGLTPSSSVVHFESNGPILLVPRPICVDLPGAPTKICKSWAQLVRLNTDGER